MEIHLSEAAGQKVHDLSRKLGLSHLATTDMIHIIGTTILHMYCDNADLKRFIILKSDLEREITASKELYPS